MVSKDELIPNIVWDSGYNAALDWAAAYIAGAQMDGNGPEVVRFAKNMEMSILAAKRKLVKENFFDAVRDDPDMTPEQKAYWLAQEPQAPPPAK